ncbi:RND family efflux transporter MFP subunit [Melioribacter roseus P3M-2]|uniref:RND family efflux transporter MFP subunit n=1 Tax=Melioribacter roseus (strain DSM 23840 / JCM 17771 / VKM B-2668 / P3M-2) TaxID=1191523 RepID=I6ZR08_MELRP|nr:efflux RND transporter periplasmic adaptor subunit [Melioribacter roseus]AFN74494.1 RND family efflux transporter MFP subunit [Melioribacter roseus P3M-2]
MKLKGSNVLMFFSISLFLILTACSQEDKSAKSMEEIYHEEGIPVKVKTVEMSRMSKKYLYNAVLEGIEETSKCSMIGDRVEKIYAEVGDFVKKDQPIIKFPNGNPSIKYNQAKVAFENAQSTYKRYEELYKEGGVSKQELDNIKTQYEIAKADLEAVEQVIEVRAPIDGYITNIAVKETQNVDKDQLLFTISNTNILKAKIKISEQEIEYIKTGQKAYAKWKEYIIGGKVKRISMLMNPITKSFDATVEFNNALHKLKAGVTANIYVEEEIGDGIFVHRENILREGNDYYVYLTNNGKAQKRKNC